MTCPKCQTHSCYICRQVINNGYSHFASSVCESIVFSESCSSLTFYQDGTIRPGICSLWDLVENNHEKDVRGVTSLRLSLFSSLLSIVNQVKEAGERAAREYAKANAKKRDLVTCTSTVDQTPDKKLDDVEGARKGLGRIIGFGMMRGRK